MPQPIPAYFLKHDLTLEPYLGSGAYGETYGAKYTRKGYVRAKRRVIKNGDGVEVVCTAIAYLAPSPKVEVATESRVTYKGKTYIVRNVEPYDDSYIELLLEP